MHIGALWAVPKAVLKAPIGPAFLAARNFGTLGNRVARYRSFVNPTTRVLRILGDSRASRRKRFSVVDTLRVVRVLVWPARASRSWKTHFNARRICTRKRGSRTTYIRDAPDVRVVGSQLHPRRRVTTRETVRGVSIVARLSVTLCQRAHGRKKTFPTGRNRNTSKIENVPRDVRRLNTCEPLDFNRLLRISREFSPYQLWRSNVNFVNIFFSYFRFFLLLLLFAIRATRDS